MATVEVNGSAVGYSQLDTNIRENHSPEKSYQQTAVASGLEDQIVPQTDNKHGIAYLSAVTIRSIHTRVATRDHFPFTLARIEDNKTYFRSGRGERTLIYFVHVYIHTYTHTNANMYRHIFQHC
jgi:hypothetical protein